MRNMSYSYSGGYSNSFKYIDEIKSEATYVCLSVNN